MSVLFACARVDAGIVLARTKSEGIYGVAQYFGSEVLESKLWIAMEFMDGGSVLDHVPLAEQHIAIVVREVLLGLRCLMEDRKLHRDIKCGA